MSLLETVTEITPIVSQAAKIKKFLLGGNAIAILNEIGDNRFNTAKRVLTRARSVKAAGLEMEIRIARDEFLGAYEAYQKQLTGFRGFIRRVSSAAIPYLSTYTLYEKISMTAVFMALCDKALGEPALLQEDIEAAKEAFRHYAERLEAQEIVEIGPDVEMEQKEKAYKMIKARQNKEKALFEKFCQSLLKTS